MLFFVIASLLVACGDKNEPSAAASEIKVGDVLMEFRTAFNGTVQQSKLVYREPYQIVTVNCASEGCASSTGSLSKDLVEALVIEIKQALASPAKYTEMGPLACSGSELKVVTIGNEARVLHEAKFCNGSSESAERFLSGAPQRLIQWALSR